MRFGSPPQGERLYVIRRDGVASAFLYLARDDDWVEEVDDALTLSHEQAERALERFIYSFDGTAEMLPIKKALKAHRRRWEYDFCAQG